MKYSEAYQRTRDIDWFFRVGNRCIHVASNGGKLPDFVNDILRLRQEQTKVALLKSVNEDNIIVNNQYIEERLMPQQQYGENNNREAYLSSFRDMACKGFYSYDRALEVDSKYVLVCGPNKDGVSVEGLQLLEANDEIIFTDEEKNTFSVLTKYSE